MMPSIFGDKNTSAPSVFLPAALLREARRQKGLATVDVPPVCILDPDGDIVRRLRQTGQSRPFEHWPCYHTELDTFLLGETEVGIVGRALSPVRASAAAVRRCRNLWAARHVPWLTVSH